MLRARATQGPLWRLSACAWLLSLVGAQAAFAEGPGILLGRQVVVHPGLATELRYDSNVFFSNARVGLGLPASSFILRVLPSIDISSVSMRRNTGLAPAKAEFRFHAGMDYREFLTPNEQISRHRAFGFDLGAMLSLFPRGPFNVEIYDNFIRTSQPPYSFNPYNFDRHTNVFGTRFRFSPGGQRLILSLIYELGYDGFEDIENGPKLSDFNLIYNNLTVRGTWKFLPKTALFLDIHQGFNTYLNPTGNEGARIPSYPLRIGAGLMGLFTQKLAMNLFGGYGNGFYSAGPSPSTAVVQAEIKYKPTLMTQLTGAYRHDFVNSLLGSYFDLDSLSVNASQVIYRVTFYVRFSWERMAYQGSEEMLRNSGICRDGEIMPCVPQTDRVDNFLIADIKAEYPIREWLLPSIGYTFQSNISNAYTRVQTVLAPVSFTKHEAWLRLSIRY